MRTLRKLLCRRFNRELAAYHREQATFYTRNAAVADESGLVLTAATCRRIADSHLDRLAELAS